MRTLEVGCDYDIPRTPMGWTIIGDVIEARVSYVKKHKRLTVNVGMGFFWAIEAIRPHDVSLVWRALARHVAPRVVDCNDLRITDSAIVKATMGPKLRLRFEGD